MAEDTAIDLKAQVACVRRECGLRRRVYPRWVAAGKMTQEAADRQIATMEAVQATLEKMLADECAADAQSKPGLF